MTDDERRAFGALRLSWVPNQDDVWRTSAVHVDGLHGSVAQAVLAGLADAKESNDSSPVGVIIQGQKGAGKTHMLGWLREKVHADGGYFFLIGLLDAGTFWRSIVSHMLQDLGRQIDDGETQLHVLLWRLATMAGVPRAVRRSIAGDATLTRATLDTFVEALRKVAPQVGRESQDIVRALVLRASEDQHAQDVGESVLYAQEEEELGERAAWGIRRTGKTEQEIVRDLSRLLALTGPTVIAVDQIDALITRSTRSTASTESEDWRQAHMAEQIAGGLMTLRETTRRTLSVVSCLPATWAYIKRTATDTVSDRFREATQLETLPSAEIGQALIAKRFAVHYQAIGFVPPYATWPVTEAAFERAHEYTPRQLLVSIDRHIRSCVDRGVVEELDHLGEVEDVELVAADPTPASDDELADLDARFAELKRTADIDAAMDPATEDTAMPPLLSAGLSAWIVELGLAGEAFSQDSPPGTKPDLHARLRKTIDEATEDEEHWGFRAVGATHHLSALNRIRRASTTSGLTAGVTKRRLFLLRNRDWSNGAKTREVVAAFEEAGGRTLRVEADDLHILAALRVLLEENPASLRAWISSRRPAGDIKVLREALADTDTGPVVGDISAASTVRLGTATNEARPVTVDLEALRKHLAIFAGSGSGKTVLIRRIVEECALRGVSAIVLDPNNDLARLGDPWPEAPAGWGPHDPARAAEYLENTDVVVWTPRREAGRPLSFQPLPDFNSVLDNRDEFDAAIDAAIASLAPRARADGKTTKAELGQAVLREALRYYARRGESNLKGFVAMLSDLPDGVSELDKADRIAAELSQSLTAAMVNDPLFGGGGEPVDPGTLLTPPAGKRARVSVVSMIGLPSDDQRQSFVNQLQMALFAWIKQNPAGDRPLGGLFVMDEAQTLAPSGAMTACTHSTLALASQARKYGLGLVFATQSPRGLHNRIPGNATTQFFGLLNAPIQIAAAKEMAQAKGGDVPDISRLRAGEFYAALEGQAFEKLATPLCLSHHPKSPLTTEEVIARARRAEYLGGQDGLLR